MTTLTQDAETTTGQEEAEGLGRGLRAAASAIADTLTDPERVARIAGAPENTDPVFGMSLWAPTTLSHGYPGTAMLFAELSREQAQYGAIAHRHLEQAMETMPSHPANGLFAGPGSVLATTQTCAASYGGYTVLRRRLTTWVASEQLRRIDAWVQRRNSGARGVGWGSYDIINGLSGTGRLLLDALTDPELSDCRDLVEDAVNRTIEHLAAVCMPITYSGHTVPGWWIPSDLQPSPQDAADYPQGDFNLGLAHGAPGMLAFLGVAAQFGVRSDAGDEALDRLATWILQWADRDEYGPFWPARISMDHQMSGTRPPVDFTRSAWCYGAPGVATALQHAGVGIGRPELCAAAVEGLRSVLARPKDSWKLDGATLCHGTAGLAVILLRIGCANKDPQLIDAAVTMAVGVATQLDPSAPFRMKHIVPDSPHGWRTASSALGLDVAGLLEGAAGIGCALLDVSRYLNVPRDGHSTGVPACSWSRAMMLS